MGWSESSTAKKRLRGRALQQRRAQYRRFQPLCVACQAKGFVREWDELDHIVPLHKGGTDDTSNLQGLCIPCHKEKTERELSMLQPSFYPTWLKPAACHLTMVIGPPGSGKTTYAQQHMQPDDRLIDLDLLMCEVSGLPIYQVPPNHLAAAARLRNRRLGALSRPGHPPAWFITTAIGDDRAWWETKLEPARVVVMETSEAACISRIHADARRPEPAKRAALGIVGDWFAAAAGRATKSGRRRTIGLDGFPIEG